MICQAEIAELLELSPAATPFSEGGVDYVLLPDEELPSGCNPPRTDLLLCPSGRDGYASRLFFSHRIQSKVARNWHMTAVIGGRTWHVYSWRLAQNGLTAVQVLRAHLEALE